MGDLRVPVEFRGYKHRGKRLDRTVPVVAQGLADTGAVYTYITRALAERVGAMDLGQTVTSVTGTGQQVRHPLAVAALRIGGCPERPTIVAIHDAVAASGGGVLLGHLTLQERRAVIDYRDHSLTCPDTGEPFSPLMSAIEGMASHPKRKATGKRAAAKVPPRKRGAR